MCRMAVNAEYRRLLVLRFKYVGLRSGQADEKKG